jgi:nuclear transport factor 2 (NTF2) superfamily protein
MENKEKPEITINERGEIIGANRESVPQSEQEEAVEPESQEESVEFIDKEAFLESMQAMSGKKNLGEMNSRKEKIDYVREVSEEAQEQSFLKGLEEYEDSLDLARTEKEALGQETIKEYQKLDSQRINLQKRLEKHVSQEEASRTSKEKWEKKKEDLLQEIKDVSHQMAIAENNKAFKGALDSGRQVIDKESLQEARLNRENLGQEIIDKEQVLKDNKENLEEILAEYQKTSGEAKSLKEIKEWCFVKKEIEGILSETIDKLNNENLIDLLGDEEKIELESEGLDWKEIIGPEKVEKMKREMREGLKDEKIGSKDSVSEKKEKIFSEVRIESSKKLSKDKGDESFGGKVKKFLGRMGLTFLLIIPLLLKKAWETSRDMVYSAFGLKKKKKENE